MTITVSPPLNEAYISLKHSAGLVRFQAAADEDKSSIGRLVVLKLYFFLQCPLSVLCT